MCHNTGISKETLNSILFPSENETNKAFNAIFVEKLIKIICNSCQSDSKIRICTLELGLKLLMSVAVVNNATVLSDAHLAAIVGKYYFFKKC